MKNAGLGACAVLLLACAAQPLAAQSPAARQPGADRAAAGQASATPGAQTCAVSTREKLTEVKSPKYGYGILLPGQDWKLECDREAVLAGSWDFFHMSIKSADPEITSLGERERLEALLQRLRGVNEANGLSMASPRIERSENKLTLSYDVAGAKLDGRTIKSAHSFATITPRGGPALILHVSWTGPESEWKGNVSNLLRLLTVPFLPL